MVKKMIVLGLDGMTFKLLDPLVEQGYLPNIAQLMNKGVTGVLRSTLPPNTAAAWTTFQLGVNPNRHGIFDFMRYRGNLESLNVVDSGDIKYKTFYETLNSKYKCVLINLPLSEPPKIKGTVMPSFISKTNAKIYPKSLEKKLDIKEFEVFIPHFKRVTNILNEAIKFLDKRKKEIDKVFDMDWDFYFELFSITDWVQHLYFPTILKNKKAIKIYQRVDEIIGEYMKKAGEDTTILIMSDHGFKKYKNIFYLNRWLKQEGYLQSKEKSLDDYRSDIKLLNFLSKHKFTKEVSKFLFKVLPLAPEVRLRAESKLSPGIDVENSRAFCPNGEVSGIFINDKRFTSLVKDTDRKKIISEITAKLKQLPYIKNITVNEPKDNVPDILLEVDDYKIYENISSRVTEELPINYHDRNGIFIACGPRIKNSAIRLENLNIADLAPTILHMFGFRLSNSDGRILKEIFK